MTDKLELSTIIRPGSFLPGVYSYRLTEVMLAGAVPVILSNGWVLPFSEFLEYDAFAVRLDEHTFQRDPPKGRRESEY